jgi:hypothetical protein
MRKFVLAYTLDGTGRRFGGKIAGEYTKVVEAENMMEAVAELHPGDDCRRFEIRPVTDD